MATNDIATARETEARDLALIERHLDELNAEAEEALEYQVSWGLGPGAWAGHRRSPAGRRFPRIGRRR